jgi:Tfp pilus assembly protein PilE
MDTLHAYETLRSKFDEDTAKTIVGAMAGLVTPSFADLATKTDLEQAKTELRTELHDVKAEIEQLRLSTKADIEQLRLATESQIDRVKTELRTEIQEVKAGMEQLRLSTKADVADTRAELLDKMRTTTLTIVGANLAALAVATGILLKILGG